MKLLSTKIDTLDLTESHSKVDADLKYHVIKTITWNQELLLPHLRPMLKVTYFGNALDDKAMTNREF